MIRIANKDDVKDIIRVQKSAFGKISERLNSCSLPPMKETAEELEKKFDDNHIFVYEIDGKIVGSIRLEKSIESAEIRRLIVHQDYQKKGIGKELLQYILNFDKNIKRFTLFTENIENNPAVKLYKNYGFKIFKQKVMCDGTPLIWMEKLNS